ncbi:uncharacterized protein TRUGW13939_07619 [Talaromyces rugulosus]|uniref:Nephrocystin 3-like N-terminal domain-containing protein n=1 Tax=Talaromyces rugulosus TaxID=121627 RepID=A0A7H8R265_TALRU|nr:uncharacterized protein TRUGW13939_07619 [Talaromyces rugulosus]QKX60474.1 hypothetical protein TRUGW13939_07619 [Talaromyces rugulosus]
MASNLPFPPELVDCLPEAVFNAASKDHSPSCLKNTRRDVLKQIEKWANSSDERRIYWLKGMAGIGKSTIALTVARKYAGLERLGASFFFSRGGGDLASSRKFAATIAAQLADAIPGLQRLIEDAITSNSRIRSLGLYGQWEKLVLEPLSQLGKNVCLLPVVVVIDALDECDNEDDVSLLIQCLAAATAVESLQLRVFVTSRPEQPINLGFDSISSGLHRDYILHDIEQSIVDQDLVLFYKDRLSHTAKKFGLGNRILSDETIQILVRKSNGLFIHAATVCRFIEEGGQLAGERLSLVIAAGSTPSKPEKELDQIYTTVLIHSLPMQLEPEEVAEMQALFRRIVGSIIVLSEAMTPTDLAAMLGERKDVILSTIHGLHSLLDVPGETKPIRLLHPSLRDFLLDPVRCQSEKFFVNDETIHSHLFSCCLRLMKNLLKKNICKMEQPGIRTREIPKATVKQCISLPLQYACRYWIYHLRQSGVDPNDSTEIMDFFQTRFLYWLETLSLIGRLSEGITMIRLLETKLAVSFTTLNLKGLNSTKLRTMLSSMKKQLRLKPIYAASSSHPSGNILHATVYDAMRFALSHGAIIAETPLQVYCSALVFSPEKSIIRKHYSNEIPKWILQRPIIHEDWRPYLQTLKGHSDWVTAVAFSPDCRLIASASRDRTIWLWDAITGTEQRVLKGHSNWVNAVAFSPDSRLIASASRDRTIRLWDVITGTEQRVLKGHSGWVNSIAFSPDGRLIASASRDWTIWLWDAITGTKQHVLKGHSMLVNAIAFSPDGRLIASASCDGTIWLWDAITGTEQRVLKGHSNWVNAVAFSPDGRLIASGDGSIRLWNTTTGTEQRVLKGHSGWVNAIAFSPDGRLIASASDDLTVRLWDVTTGIEQRVLKGHSDSVNAIAFSPDSQLIASASNDGTIRLWDATKGMKQRVSKGHLDSVNAIAFSPDSRLIALGSRDRTIRLWDAITGTEQRVLKHSGWVNAIAFSPDGRLIASASRDGTIRLWDAITGTKQRVLKVLKGHSKLVNAIAFSPDGRLIASASCDGTIWLWDAITGTEQRVLKGHSEWVDALAFSPEGHPNWVNAVVFSPDGRLIASASGDGTIRLWDAITDTKQRVLKGHSDSVNAVAFSPDGRLIASASRDGTIRLWDAITGTEQQVYVTETTLLYLSFCGTLLITDRGVLRLPQVVPQPPQHHIFVSGSWVRNDAENFLFLHPDYIDHVWFVSGDILVFENDSGSSILQFDHLSKIMIGGG